MGKVTLTYKTFGEMAITLANAIADNEIEIDGFDKDAFIEKAEKLIGREEKKSDYSKNNKKPAESKVSETTIANAEAVLEILTTEPQTTLEIFTALGWEFDQQRSPLKLSNLIRYLTDNRKIAIVKPKKPEAVKRIKDGIECTDMVPKTAYALSK